MNTTSDRRAPGTTRIPFDAMVEVGGALGPSFEAQAVNVSGEGMSLRTAYLPEVGQPVTCRFDPGNGAPIVAAGAVAWNEEAGDGGEFGIRFTKLDPASASALQKVLGVTTGGAIAANPSGQKVRLHIDGLASPMRARVKSTRGNDGLTAVSELGFLQLGRSLDLEDAASGEKRPASIDRVDVELQQESRVPQLVVTLRFEDEAAHASREDVVVAAKGESLAPVTIAGSTASAAVEVEDEFADELEGEFSEEDDEEAYAADAHADDPIRGGVRVRFDEDADDAFDSEGEEDDVHAAGDAGHGVKEKMTDAAAKIGPAMEKWAKRAKSTVSVLAARAMAKKASNAESASAPVRRTTAPAPGGGLHASGRKVVRGENATETKKTEDASKKIPLAHLATKKNAVIAGSVGLAVLLGTFAFGSSSKPAETASTPVVAASALPVAPVEATPPAPVQANVPVVAPAPMPVQDEIPAPRMASNSVPVDDDSDPAPVAPRKKARPTPFGSNAVTHGNVLRLKMDGDIEQIHGASQPTGFTIVLPKRKSLEAAAPLASRDSRIASMRVANEDGGAELSVSFKDGVPNYQVRAKGDTLEIVLAQAGQAGDRAPEAHVVKKKSTPTTTTKRTRRHR